MDTRYYKQAMCFIPVDEGTDFSYYLTTLLLLKQLLLCENVDIGDNCLNRDLILEKLSESPKYGKVATIVGGLLDAESYRSAYYSVLEVVNLAGVVNELDSPSTEWWNETVDMLRELMQNRSPEQIAYVLDEIDIRQFMLYKLPIRAIDKVGSFSSLMYYTCLESKWQETHDTPLFLQEGIDYDKLLFEDTLVMAQTIHECVGAVSYLKKQYMSSGVGVTTVTQEIPRFSKPSEHKDYAPEVSKSISDDKDYM